MNSTTRKTSTGRRLGALVAGTTVTALALTACGGSSDPDTSTTAPGGTAASGEVDPNAIIEAGISYSLGGSFDPALASGAVTLAANWHTMEGLTELDPVTREVYPGLGAALPTAVDETTFEVDLRDGAVFHDGSAVTADDVVFSFERVMDPETGSLFASFVDFIDTVEAVDEDTVRITTEFPFSLVNERLSTVKIVPQAIVEADPEAFGALPTGSGPYKITSAVAEDSLTFERFDDYTGTRPAQAAGMKWNLLSDSAARVTAMSSGTIHAMEDVPYIDVPSLEGQVKVESAQSFGLLFAMFNTDKAPFDDVRVRQAFLYALDMDKLIETGLLGNAEAATSFLQQTHPNFNEASTVYSYDPEKAKALLKEAGHDSLDITLMTTDTGWVQAVAPLIKESLDGVGINTTLDIGQSSGQYTKVDAGDMEVMIAPGDPSVFGNDPDLLMRWWYGDNVWPESRFRWSDTPEYAELVSIMDEAVRLTDDAQQEKWNEAFDLLSEEVPLYPLFHRQLPTAWDDTQLVGFKPVAMTGLSFLDVGVANS
ncbi:peptide/nickel transport system substrate-binding protein [Flavimobilis marinus]|uniref:Peptide/nickel transport system substrate-binding protein n=1 Tax=Flavimobilis marinus TaxID=285351 RepID=A0A1I2GPF2_9MICO|nr:ABC transporter substrate-binding protein [Flavimobilis marinus]SFF18556.1 peptide/nickel transport system substrate-binding protein [Flavimobilis marinus]